MTVKELIELLSKMPQDYEVIYRCCSDWAKMDPVEVRVQDPTKPPGHVRSPQLVLGNSP
jgi:hypothetical protein